MCKEATAYQRAQNESVNGVFTACFAASSDWKAAISSDLNIEYLPIKGATKGTGVQIISLNNRAGQVYIYDPEPFIVAQRWSQVLLERAHQSISQFPVVERTVQHLNRRIKEDMTCS